MTIAVGQRPKVSIVTPLLNSVAFLPDMLACLSAQTFPDWEHIIVDGGSVDGSLEIAEEWQLREPRAKLIKAPSLGLYPSVLLGLEATSADLLGWLNADDIYPSWSLRVATQYFKRTKHDWFTGFPGCWDRDGALRYTRPYGWYPKTLIKAGWFHADLLGFLQQESMFFSRTLFSQLTDQQKQEISKCALAGDFVLWRSFAEMSALRVVPTSIGGFRQHGANLSANHMGEYMEEVRQHGGTFMPGFVMHAAGRLFRSASALAALNRVYKEDMTMHEEQSVK